MRFFRRKHEPPRSADARPPTLPGLASPGSLWVQLDPSGPWHRLREPDPSELADTVTIEKDGPMTTDPMYTEPIRVGDDFYATAALHEDEQEDSTPLHTATAASPTSPAPGPWAEPPMLAESPQLLEQVPADADDRRDCPHCRGTGKVLTVNDLLRESVGLLDGNEDAVVREFYARLLDAAPHLAELFPPDLLGTDETHHQRDRLLAAIVALATHYNPDDAAAMATLDTALASYGRAHSAFRVPSTGEVRGATLEEYVAVKATLFGTLHDAAGAAWLDEYDEVWSQAYDYAAVRMLVAQLDSPQRFGRFPRQAR